MSKPLVIFMLVLAGLFADAQDQVFDTLPASVAHDSGENLFTPPKRMKTHVIIGTQFTNSSWYGSGLSTFISPTISYRVSPRFTLGGGFRISNTTLFNYRPWYEIGPSQTYDANFTKTLIWVKGSYMVTDRLMISGAGFKEFTLTDNSPGYNPYTNNNPYGIYLNATYKINDRMFIQAGFGYTRDQMPYFGSPMYDPSPFSRGSFHQMPFRNDPFHSDPFYNDPFR